MTICVLQQFRSCNDISSRILKWHYDFWIHNLVSYCLLLEGALREKEFGRFFEVFLVSHAWTSHQLELTRVIYMLVYWFWFYFISRSTPHCKVIDTNYRLIRKSSMDIISCTSLRINKYFDN